jgi:hypothetical protein
VGEREGVGEKGRGRGEGGEMTQTLYAHMNKRKKMKKKNFLPFWFSQSFEYPSINASGNSHFCRIPVEF